MFNVDIATYHKQCTKRTLSEAFPDERANAIEVHRPTFNAWKFVDRLCAVLFVVLVGLVAVGAL